MRYPDPIQKLMLLLRKFPGVGGKTAERFAFALLEWTHEERLALAQQLHSLDEELSLCNQCGCLQGVAGCSFCSASWRDKRQMCVIAFPKDAFAIEGTGEFRGLYHVLGGLLSPLQRRAPEDLAVDALKQRIAQWQVEELILGLDATFEGDATALFLQQELSSTPVRISRLAFGLPMGSSFDYVDGGTLARAFSARGTVS